jgi:hypothetical protein
MKRVGLNGLKLAKAISESVQSAIKMWVLLSILTAPKAPTDPIMEISIYRYEEAIFRNKNHELYVDIMRTECFGWPE